jgi:hypothetical protein
MKSALSLTLIVCLLRPAMPIAAQEPTGSFDPGGHASPLTAGSPAGTAASAAVRLAAAGESAPSGIDTIQRGTDLTVSAQSVLSRSRQVRSTWDELSRMITGMDIRMTLPDSTLIRGRALEVRPDALVVDVRRTSNPRLHAKGRTEIPRSDVCAIEPFLRRSPAAHPDAGAIGAAIGGVAVSPLLLRLGETNKISSRAALAIFIGAAAAGAVLANHIHDNPGHVLITVVPQEATRLPGVLPER